MPPERGRVMEISLLHRFSPIISVDPVPRPQERADASAAVVTAVRALNKSELLGNHELLFARDSATRTTVIQIVERNTGEVLEQIPPEQVLQMMAQLAEQIGSKSTL